MWGEFCRRKGELAGDFVEMRRFAEEARDGLLDLGEMEKCFGRGTAFGSYFDWQRMGRVEHGQNIVGAGGEVGAGTEKRMTAGRNIGKNGAGDGKDVAILGESELGGNERTGFDGRFDDHRCA